MNGYKGPRFWFRYLEFFNSIRNLPKGSNVLEIGTGTFEVAIKLAKNNTVTTIDLSDKIYEYYSELDSEYKQKINCIQGNFLTYEFNEERFDLVVAMEVMEHIDDEKDFLEKINRITTPGAMVVISVPAHMKFWSRHDMAVGHLRRYEKSDLDKVAEYLCAKDYKIISYGWPWLSFTRLLRIATTNLLYNKSNLSNQSERSVISGHRFHQLSILKFLSNRFSLYPFWLLSRFFNHTDFSDGYLLQLTKSDTQTSV